MKYMKRKLAEAIEWRFRERLEAERLATIELGKTFVETTALLVDQVRELETRLEVLENRSTSEGSV